MAPTEPVTGSVVHGSTALLAACERDGMDDAEIAERLADIEANGYTIVVDAIDPELTAGLRDTVRRIFDELGIEPKGNRAEGFATKRMYNLVPRAEIFEQLPVHDNLLPLVEQLLEPDCLLSGTTAMDIGPGEPLQGLHADDGFFRIGRPHQPMMATTIWALTDFTADNGATRIVPGSHREPGHPDPYDESVAVPAEMPAGSVLVMDSQLWHCGGPNTTEDEWRLGLNVQYVRGFFRTQQNHYLGVPHDKVRRYPKRLRELLGFELYRGIMGHIEGHSPAAVIGADPDAHDAYSASSTDNPFGNTEGLARQAQ
jgi:ectoine hydroxylase-related dioxygenase (phytanoyl-CoA dioxygenase family)